MSKTTLKKAIAQLTEEQLRGLILEVYEKSKESREWLNFFAEPDIDEKLEDYKAEAYKEVMRYKRHLPMPRLAKLRKLIKKFSLFEPGDELVIEFQLYVFDCLCRVVAVSGNTLACLNVTNNILTDILKYIEKRKLVDEYLPALEKSLGRIPRGYSGGTLRNLLDGFLDNLAENGD